MKLIIHDLSREDFKKVFDSTNTTEDIKIISNEEDALYCIGCFGCWIKTPGICILKDQLQDMGKWLAKSDEVIVISECIYGGYSPFVATVFNRSISYVLPHLITVNGEMHHGRRYKNHSPKFKVLFYGNNLTNMEKTTAKDLVYNNSKNFYSQGNTIEFYSSIDEMEVS